MIDVSYNFFMRTNLCKTYIADVLMDLATMQEKYNKIIEKEKIIKSDLSLFNLEYEKLSELSFKKVRNFMSLKFNYINVNKITIITV